VLPCKINQQEKEMDQYLKHVDIVKIQDSGVPIPAENLGIIVEPLFTTKHQGTGLGLTSCKQIIEKHGGHITASNDPTTFTVKIPKVKN